MKPRSATRDRICSACGRLRSRTGLVLILALAGGPACRTGHLLLGGGEYPGAKATLGGTVRGPEESAPLAGRRVEAIAVPGGRRYATHTSVTGGFTFLLPPGRYRLELALASVETVVEKPDVVELEPGGVVANVDFVVGGAGVAFQ